MVRMIFGFFILLRVLFSHTREYKSVVIAKVAPQRKESLFHHDTGIALFYLFVLSLLITKSRLISHCSSTNRYIHYSCLLKEIIDLNHVQCESCNQKYSIETVHRSIGEWNLNELSRVSIKIILFLVIIFFLNHVTLQ